MKCSIKFAVVLVFLPGVLSSSILFYFGSSPLSHRLAAWPLAKELSVKGHSITFLSAWGGRYVKSEGIKEIDISEIISSVKHAFYKSPWDLRLKNEQNLIWDIAAVNSVIQCEVLMASGVIHEWIKSSSYDLIILDSPNNECGLGLVSLFSSKLLIFSSATPPFMGIPDSHGFLPETSWNPDLQLGYSTEMNYFQRIMNTARAIRWHLFKEVYLFGEVEKAFSKTLPKELQLRLGSSLDFNGIEKNASLILVNSHFSEDFGRSVPPSVISVGGIHITNSTKLPKALSDFIWSDGFFFVSFGSALNTSEMPQMIKEILLKALETSGHKFIVKTDFKLLRKSGNIYTSDWLPQQTLLAHPKILGMITTGSTLSMQEAIYNKVPIIIIPIMLEQLSNAHKINRLGIGITLEIGSLTEYNIHESLNNIVHNKTILKNVKKISQKFRDRPMSALALGVWWIEYVLRNENTKDLHPLGIHQSWILRRQLDVWVPFLMLIFIFLILTIYLAYFTIRKFFFALKEYLEERKDKTD